MTRPTQLLYYFLSRTISGFEKNLSCALCRIKDVEEGGGGWYKLFVGGLTKCVKEDGCNG